MLVGCDAAGLFPGAVGARILNDFKARGVGTLAQLPRQSVATRAPSQQATTRVTAPSPLKSVKAGARS